MARRPPNRLNTRVLSEEPQSHLQNQPLGFFQDSLESVWSDEATPDRLQRDYVGVFPEYIVRQFRSGYRCLRCQEPQATAFPDICDLCGYPMKDRQIMDFAMEYEGDRHLGPAKPISEYQAELELRAEKRRYEQGKEPKGVIIGKKPYASKD